MFETPRWSRRVAKFVFAYRHILMMLVVAGVISLGIYLYIFRSWTGKDMIQACTGLLILLTLFFAGLNYEFTSSKARRDYESAKQLLTFTTSSEWHVIKKNDKNIWINFTSLVEDWHPTIREQVEQGLLKSFFLT